MATDYTDRSTPALTPAAAKVLDVASALFYDRGIHAVGVDTIAEAAQVTKKTIYDRFRSKDNLITAYLERRDHQYRRWLTEWIDAGPLNPKDPKAPRTEPVLAVFDALDAWMRTHGPRGCAFVNASGELADPDHPAHRIAREHKAWLREYLRALATESGLPHPDTVADQVLTLHEGAIVLYSTGGDPHAVTTARAAAAALLVPPPRPRRTRAHDRTAS